MIPFGPFAPDAGETTPGISMVANGVLPLADGYGPVASLVTPGSSSALPGAPRGLISTILRDGTNQVFAFTADTIQQLQTDYSWLEIENGYSCTSGDDWSAEPFGSQLLYTNTTDGLQAYDLESPGTPTYIADAGDPREIFTCSNAVVALDCLDQVGDRNNRLIMTSQRGNHTNWKNKGADYQPLEDGGALVCGKDLKNNAAVVFQEDAMQLMQFGNVGGGAAFSLAKIAAGRGSIGKRSVVAFDGVVYFWATNGFWRFSLGGGIEPLGAGKIDNWFFKRVDQSNLAAIQMAVDPQKKIVWTAWKRAGAADEPAHDILGYSWEHNKFCTGTETVSYLGRIATPGYTLNTASAAFGVLDDAPAIPLDDRFWQGGQPVFAALDGDYKFAAFSGASAAATLESSVQNSPVTGLMTWATGIDDAGGTLELGVKDDLQDTIAWKDAVAKVSAGRFPIRGRGMNCAFRRNIPAADDWTYAKGMDHVKGSAGGPK